MGLGPSSIQTGLSLHQHLVLLPMALCYCMNALTDMLCQVSRMSRFSVRMQRILCLICLSAELPYKKHIECLPFEGEVLFGPFLDKYNKDITGGKSTLLQNKKPQVCRQSYYLGIRKSSYNLSQASSFQNKVWEKNKKDSQV